MRIGIILVALIGLSGCLGTVELPRLTDVELAEETPQSGLIAPETKAAETALEELQNADTVLAAKSGIPQEEAATEPEKPRRGLFALFGGKREKPAAPTRDQAEERMPVAESATPQDKGEAQGDIVVAAVAPQKPSRTGRSLFGPRRSNNSRFPQVEPGTVLRFGQIGVACGIRGRALGKEVDRFPDGGKGYRLYDTNPSTTQPRTHFLTGFKDGCPRQFTASLALLGSPVLHEQLLSVEHSRAQHLNAADKAFEKIRAQVCRVGRGKPCPEKRVGALEKSMAFVTIYERFGGNASWEEILLHNGVVTATSVK